VSRRARLGNGSGQRLPKPGAPLVAAPRGAWPRGNYVIDVNPEDLRGGRENPFARDAGLSHLQDRQQPRRRWDAPPRCLALALEDFYAAVSDVFPGEPVAFFRSQPAVE